MSSTATSAGQQPTAGVGQVKPLLDGMTRTERRRWEGRTWAQGERAVRQVHLVHWVRGWPWEWFATGTYGECRSAEAARRRFRWWLRQVNEAAHGKRWKRARTGLYGVVAFEAQKRGDWHWHALLARTNGLRYRTAHELHDGFLWLRGLQGDNEHAVRYVVKYVTKGGDWDVVGHWRHDPAGAERPAAQGASGQRRASARGHDEPATDDAGRASTSPPPSGQS